MCLTLAQLQLSSLLLISYWQILAQKIVTRKWDSLLKVSTGFH